MSKMIRVGRTAMTKEEKLRMDLNKEWLDFHSEYAGQDVCYVVADIETGRPYKFGEQVLDVVMCEYTALKRAQYLNEYYGCLKYKVCNILDVNFTAPAPQKKEYIPTYLYKMTVSIELPSCGMEYDVYAEAFNPTHAYETVEEDLIMRDYSRDDFKISKPVECEIFFNYSNMPPIEEWEWK